MHHLAQKVALPKFVVKWASMKGTMASPKSVVSKASCATVGKDSHAIKG
jgi:hypothetical protein